MTIYADLSEFLANPITTGIQRVVGEMCRYLPPEEITPARLHHGRFLAFSHQLVQAIGSHFEKGSTSGVSAIRELSDVSSGVPVHISGQDILLVPEVFDGRDRLFAYRSLPEEQFQRCRFIVFDLLPLTHPEYFDRSGSTSFYGYAQLLRRNHFCGFISEYSQDMYYKRLRREDTRGGVVLRLGCDSLGPRSEQPSLSRALEFTVVGTIEPRKNHQLILEAFEPLLRQIKSLRLTFIGKMGWVDAELSQRILKLDADPASRFRFVPAPQDSAVRAQVERSRATIYVSSAEGYGLPPVESLWLGTPVIASRTIPSLENLGTKGIHIVHPLDVLSLRRAVLAFLDEEYANRKIQEASALDLPSWRTFSRQVLKWCQESSHSRGVELTAPLKTDAPSGHHPNQVTTL